MKSTNIFGFASIMRGMGVEGTSEPFVADSLEGFAISAFAYDGEEVS